MNLQKSQWAVGQERVSLTVPISKVDQEARLVSGFATLDNVDRADDVVTAEASKSAFEAFRGNIREMHQPIAAGRMLDFQQEEFYHDGIFYRGVYVTVYVSKGAQDTWEKVLDGTLSGFSIGGNITKSETVFVPEAGEEGKSIRFINEYELVELSLVDSPMNQLANVFSVEKSDSGDTIVKGMLSETNLLTVFWCETDEISKTSNSDSEVCMVCNTEMEQIGWYEAGGDQATKMAAAVASHLSKRGVETASKNSADEHGEGGVEMGVKVEKSAEEAAQEATEETLEKSDGAEETEAAAEVETEVEEEGTEEGVEEAPVEPDFEKMFDDLKDSVKSSIADTVQEVEKRVADATAAFDEKASELEKSLTELGEKLEAIKTEREDVAKRLDALEKASAIKKSGEVEGLEPVKKSQTGLWSGTFFDGE